MAFGSLFYIWAQFLISLNTGYSPTQALFQGVDKTSKTALAKTIDSNSRVIYLSFDDGPLSGTLNCFEICRRVHADPSLYALPIMMVSAMDSEEEMRHGFAQGADDYVTKPFRLEALLGRVESLLASSKAPMIDPMTSLPGHRFIRLELQKAINLHSEFALAYIEVQRLGEYVRLAGADERVKIVRSLSQIIQEQGKVLQDPAFRAGHMGGGHFVCIMSRASARTFGESVENAWRLSLASPSGGVRPKSTSQSVPLELLVCLTPSKGGGSQSVAEYFEILSHLRDKAIHAKQTGLYYDQRG